MHTSARENIEVDRTQQESTPARWSSLLVFISICLLSAVYFTDIFLRASVKCFWSDELVTVFLCRLPDLHSISVAIHHGADLNPPLFYWLTWGSQHLLGEGPIATRLPEIVAFYVFCLCLYFFVSRRMGHLAGFVSGVFPLFTLAQYYASEARPHALTLGFCGLALVCWQRSKEGQRRVLFLLGFFLSLTGAMLVHVYATFVFLPFILAELYETVRSRRIDWGPAVAMVLAVAAAVPSYVPLFRNFGVTAHGATSNQPMHSLGTVAVLLSNLVGHGIIVLVAAVAVGGMALAIDGKIATEWPRVPSRELVLALGFVCLPVVGILILMVTHGPFFFRYFLASIAGFSIFLGALYSSINKSSRRLALWLPVIMLLLLTYDLKTAARMRVHHEGTIEPASGFIIGSPEAPLARDTALLSMKGNLDVLILQTLNNTYLLNYAPPSLASRLYIAASTEGDPIVLGYNLVKATTHTKLNVTAFAPFLATHNHFFVYGTSTGTLSTPCGNCEQEFLNAGYNLRSVKRDLDGVLYEYSK